MKNSERRIQVSTREEQRRELGATERQVGADAEPSSDSAALPNHITEHKRLEAELESARRRLVQTQEAQRLELAQAIEDMITSQLTALGDRLTNLHHAACTATEQDAPVTAAFTAGLDAVRRQVLDLIADLHKRLEGLRTVGRTGPRLTARELAVLQLLAAGKSNREIAQALGISRKTVEKHVGNLYTKLGINSRAQAAMWAAREGLVSEFD